MSGLFKRLSSRRSGGPEGTESPTAAEPGTTDAPTSTPAEPEGRKSLLTDPAAETHVFREGEQPTGLTSGDPLAGRPAPNHAPYSAPADVNAHTRYGAPAEPAADPAAYVEPRPAAVDPNAPAPYVGPRPAAVDPNAPAPFAYPAPAAYVPPPTEPVADLPAGLDPDELGAVTGTSARRGKLRRRAAFLRAARELLLRDLGGFVYELHRTAHDIEHPAHRRLRETKLARLGRVDAELHEIETRLDDVRRQVLVREPGVGGECPHCGELFGSAAHYCSHCGNPLTAAARRELAKAQVAVPVVEEPAAAAAEPAPAAAPQPVAADDQPTQEIGPLDAGQANAEFQWPSRESRFASAQAAEAAPAAAAETVGAAIGEESPAEPSAQVREPDAAVGAATPVGEGDEAAPAEAETPLGANDAETPGPDDEAAPAVAEEETPVGAGDALTTAEAPADETDAAPTTTAEAPADEAHASPAAAETSTPGEAASPADDVPAAAAATPVGEGDAVPTADEIHAEPAERSAPDEAVPTADEIHAEPAETSAPDEAAPAADDVASAEADTPGGDGDHATDTPTDATPADEAETPTGEGEGDGAEAPANGAPAAGEDTPAPGASPASDGAPTRDYNTWRGQSANGHDESILRPVERRP